MISSWISLYCRFDAFGVCAMSRRKWETGGDRNLIVYIAAAEALRQDAIAKRLHDCLVEIRENSRGMVGLTSLCNSKQYSKSLLQVWTEGREKNQYFGLETPRSKIVAPMPTDLKDARMRLVTDVAENKLLFRCLPENLEARLGRRVNFEESGLDDLAPEAAALIQLYAYSPLWKPTAAHSITMLR